MVFASDQHADDGSLPTAVISCVIRGSAPGVGGGCVSDWSCWFGGNLSGNCGVCVGVMCVGVRV